MNMGIKPASVGAAGAAGVMALAGCTFANAADTALCEEFLSVRSYITAPGADADIAIDRFEAVSTAAIERPDNKDGDMEEIPKAIVRSYAKFLGMVGGTESARSVMISLTETAALCKKL